MKPLEEIAERMKKHPHVKYEIVGNVATIFPTSENGFEVSLSEHSSSYTVSFDNWQD
jgi:hypothetical protein